MLVNAMEVSGLEGTFRHTCTSVMSVLRENRNSVMAILEAFVYDPLINWKKFNEKKRKVGGMKRDGDTDGDGRGPDVEGVNRLARPLPMPNPTAGGTTTLGNPDMVGGVGGTKEIPMAGNGPVAGVVSHRSMEEDDEDEDESKEGARNQRAVNILVRVENKLRGRDFNTGSDAPLLVSEQVQRLIIEATSPINLCQCYIGWCYYW